nr:hypothetical protein 14 [bacterium]
MASSSTTRLTNYESSVTIVTADVANSWYGGLYGSSEGESLDADDPLVAGHVHDGEHQDGHAQKINLVSHVTSQLRNVNLADDAVTKRNVASFTDQSQAIPEYEIIGGVTYYHLDLSTVYAAIENSFGIIDISANGGSVSGDGAGQIESDQQNDTLSFVAGVGIDLETDLTDDKVTISSTVTAGDSFGQVAASATGSGKASGGVLQAEIPFDTLEMRASDGVELINDPANDRVDIRNMYSVASGYIYPEETEGNWGALANASMGSAPNDDFSYRYRQVGPDENGVFFHVPVPSNSYDDRPTKIKFRAFFIAVEDQVAGYLAGLNPNFTMRLRYGSNRNQPNAGSIDEIGTIPDNYAIVGNAGAQLWANTTDIVSSNVGDTEHLMIITWPAEILEVGENVEGLMLFKMIGQTGFNVGDPFDGDVNRASLRFVGADYTWYY